MESRNIKSIDLDKFSSADEEIAFLREQLKEKEKAIAGMGRKSEDIALTREALASETVREYANSEAKDLLANDFVQRDEEILSTKLQLEPESHDKQMEKLLDNISSKGIKNTLALVDKMANPHITDDFHRFLVQYIQVTQSHGDLKEGSPEFKAFNMKLYQISLPGMEHEDGQQKSFKEMISVMEQFYAGMLSISDGKDPLRGKNYFTLEIALANDTNEIVFFASVPETKTDLFQKQVHAVFPDAKIEEDKNDYNIFNEDGASVGAFVSSSENPIYPIKTYDEFDSDPINVILNVFSKLKEKGEGAAIQFVISPSGDYFIKRYGFALDRIKQGVKVKQAINLPDTFKGEFGVAMKELLAGNGIKKGEVKTTEANDVPMAQIKEKVSSTILNTNIRIIASGETQERAESILEDIKSAFNQFTNAQGNGMKFEEMRNRKLLKLFKEYSYRLFAQDESFPLNLKELTTVLHFPVGGTVSSQLKEAKAGSAPIPIGMPKSGVRLGINKHRGVDTEVFMSEEDRLRHMYVIGQTGTGRTTMLKNMIIQDIKAGRGVCMIDPHGTDITDILANIPKERIDDVIYFDPAHTERPMGLNMMEYDTRFPEQKTFVVDELLSIFNKLFDMKVAGGPAFEQYFRNSALLVMEHPESGNTLLEIARVMSDSKFRDRKLSHNKNPMIAQFWENAVKTTGEQSLANFVPYITNKFDVFLSNEIMRPVVAQEKSAFNMRQIMDEKKILLVNLSKGRLGDINSSLIGLVLVGKILMAALSRVDTPQGQLAPFYLYIDEFQNITTDSIATILSEARKYGLSLNIAHQFIAQLEDGIKDAVFGNAGSMVTFRVGADDAKYIESQFEPVFNASDIMNLDNRNAYVKMLASGQLMKPFSMATLAPEKGNALVAEKLKEYSYVKYGRDRAEVEAQIMKKYK